MDSDGAEVDWWGETGGYSASMLVIKGMVGLEVQKGAERCQ